MSKTGEKKNPQAARRDSPSPTFLEETQILSTQVFLSTSSLCASVPCCSRRTQVASALSTVVSQAPSIGWHGAGVQ
jgi:hypothetical protein